MSRSYFVLRANEGSGWTAVDKLEASGARQAIRQVAANGDSGVYVAVPEHNWTRLRVTVEPAKPRLVLEEDV